MGCTCKTDIFINYEFNVKSLSSCYWQKYLQTLHISFRRFKTLLSVSKMYWWYIFVIKNDTQLSNYAAYAFIWKLIVSVCIIGIVISPVCAEYVYYVYWSLLHFNVISQTTKSCNIHHSIENMKHFKHFRNKSLKVKNSYRILAIISEIRFISKYILLPQLSW